MKKFIQSIVCLFDKFRVEAVGADYNKLVRLDGTEELKKFIFNGNIIILTSLFSFFGAFFFFSELFYSYQNDAKKISLVFTFSSLWAFIIFNLDRAFVSGMLGQRGVNRFFVALPRFILAIAIGYIISHPLKMMFFDNILVAERSEKIEKKIAKDSEAIQKEIDKFRSKREQTGNTIGSLTNTELKSSLIRGMQDEIKNAQKNINRLELWEFYFVCGYGQVAEDISDFVNGRTCVRGTADEKKTVSFDSPEANETIYIRFPDSPGEGDINPRINTLSLSEAIEEHRNKVLQSNHFAKVLQRLWRDKKAKIQEEVNRLLTNNSDQLDDLQKQKFSNLQDDQGTFQSTIKAKEAQLKNIENEIESSYPDGYIYKTALLGEIISVYTSCLYNDVDCSGLSSDESFKQSKSMFWIGIFITLIFIFIEVAPIVVKLMSSMGPYEKNISSRQDQDDEKDRDSRTKRRLQEIEIEDIKNSEELLRFERIVAEKIAIDDILLNLLDEEIGGVESLDDLESLIARYAKVRETSENSYS